MHRQQSTRTVAGMALVSLKNAARDRGDTDAQRLLEQRLRCFRIASQLYRRIGPSMDVRR